jgi:hypothetical protein
MSWKLLYNKCMSIWVIFQGENLSPHVCVCVCVCIFCFKKNKVDTCVLASKGGKKYCTIILWHDLNYNNKMELPTP